MKVVIIGGTGHVGTYLVPRLIEAGHEVISVNRQHRESPTLDRLSTALLFIASCV